MPLALLITPLTVSEGLFGPGYDHHSPGIWDLMLPQGYQNITNIKKKS